MTHDEWIMESFKEGYEDGHGQAVTDMEGYLRDALSHGVTVDMDFIESLVTKLQKSCKNYLNQ